MSSIRRFFLWYWLLTKRLIKRPAYLAVPLLIPLFAAAVALFSKQDSGVLTAAIYLEDPEDPVACAVADRLLNGDSILRCVQVDSAEAAREQVRSGYADAAWLFGSDLGAGFDAFARYGSGGIITVAEREDNIFLMISREKLFAMLYPELSFAMFRNYLVREMGIEDLSEEELRDYYASGFTAEELIRFSYVDGSAVDTGGSYLTAPLRGILSLLLLLSGLASGMYCYREERDESFVWLPAAQRRTLPVLCHITAMVPPAAAVLAALAMSGVWLGLGRELMMMLLFVPACAMFCEILRCLCPREEHYGALIPILAVAILVFCPVFVSMNLGLPLRYILPPGYYLRTSLSTKALWPMLLYLAALIPLTALCSRLREQLLGKQAGKL
ncbi:MAG: hypothetical protein IKH34_06480 [Oscillospiraceae bacterium]|nr:hypothetical protein [Oscillospiraceae bacterium]